MPIISDNDVEDVRAPAISDDDVEDVRDAAPAHDECDSCKAGGPCTGCAAEEHPLYVEQPEHLASVRTALQMPQPEQAAAKPEGSSAREIYNVADLLLAPGGLGRYVAGKLVDDPVGAARGAVQGATLRLADEGEGVLRAAAEKAGGAEGSFPDIYRAKQQVALGEYNEAAQNSPRLFPDAVPEGLNPSMYDLSEAAGGMAVPGGRLAKYAGGAKTALGAAARAGTVGTLYSGVSGVGGSEANVLQGGEYGKAAGDAAKAAAIGGPLSALIGGAARGRSNQLARREAKAQEFASKATAAEENITAQKQLPKKQALENDAAAQAKSIARNEEKVANAKIKSDYDSRVAQIKANNKAGSQQYKQQMTQAKNEASAATRKAKADVEVARTQAKAEAAQETARLEAEALEQAKQPTRDQALVYAGLGKGDVAKMGGSKAAARKGAAMFDEPMPGQPDSRALEELNKLPVAKRATFIESQVDEIGAEFGGHLANLEKGGGRQLGSVTVPRAKVLTELKKGPGGALGIEDTALLKEIVAQVKKYGHGAGLLPSQTKALLDDIGKGKGRIAAFARKVLVQNLDEVARAKLTGEEFDAYKETGTRYGRWKDLKRGSDNLVKAQSTETDVAKRGLPTRDLLGVKPAETTPVQPRVIADAQDVAPRAVAPFEAKAIPGKPAAVPRREVPAARRLEAPEFEGGEEALAQIVEDLNELGPSHTAQKLAQILADVSGTGAVEAAGGGYPAKIGIRGIGRLLLSMSPRERGPITFGAKVKEAQTRAGKATAKRGRSAPELEKIIRQNPRVAQAILQYLRDNAEAEPDAR